MKVKSWKSGIPGEPKFPNKFKIIQKAVLQKTDISNNNNKYYAVELHKAGSKFRVFTHYGRTDDLNTNPNAGKRESRYCCDAEEAEEVYASIYKQKTGASKGYQQVHLASSKIGSQQAQGQSCGEVDNKTLAKMKKKRTKTKGKADPSIDKPIAELVNYLYSEAVNTLTTTVDVSITANGIETPLGVLTIGQVDTGQAILDKIATAVNKSRRNKRELSTLSGQFYTAIPHRLGRSRQAIEDAVITTPGDFLAKNETLQLMRDMLNVNGESNVLMSSKIVQKYQALHCDIGCPNNAEFNRIKKHIAKTGRQGKIKNIWKVSRPDEQKSFDAKIGNDKLLFHGSSVSNWVGILSRGILLPKAVVKLGVHRTDAGWLGCGIYFGDDINTSCAYANPGKRGTMFISIVRVALGKVKQYRKITYGLTSPPQGFGSCHGVKGSEFDDDEFVIYKQNQQTLEYLIECV